MLLSDPNNLGFDGRQISEVDASDAGAHQNKNSCYFAGADQSLDPQNPLISNPLTLQWTVEGQPNAQGQHNTYGYDTVGFSPLAVTYIRQHASLPCGFIIWQSMIMSCPNGSAPQGSYKQYNRLATIVYATQTQVCRGTAACYTNSH
jgi:hypothetical protein